MFDPASDSFTQAGPMAHPRWYPTLVPLSDGRVLAVSGVTKLVKSTQGSQVRRTETFDPATLSWSENYVGPASENTLPFQARLHLTPDGKVSTLTTVDQAGHVTNEMTGSLRQPRWAGSGLPLPDGTVLAVGGARNSHPATPGLDIALRTVEQYDPATGQWSEVAPISRDRAYHYTATLLGDGRVLIGGGAPIGTLFGPHRDAGGPFANNDQDSSFQVFSPPYLFRGDRPTVARAPAGVAWGGSFELGTPQAADIESVVLIRLPSQQHQNDSDARTIKLAFERAGADRLLVTAPPSGVIAPPGAYYLFVNRMTADGPVPSVARIVRLGAVADSAEALQPFPDSAPALVGGSASPDEDTSVGTTGAPAVLGQRRSKTAAPR